MPKVLTDAQILEQLAMAVDILNCLRDQIVESDGWYANRSRQIIRGASFIRKAYSHLDDLVQSDDTHSTF